MQNDSIKNNDELILGISNILSKNRCSFSKEEQVLLQDCIKKLNEMEHVHELHAKAELFIKVLGILMKVFSIAEHFKNLF